MNKLCFLDERYIERANIVHVSYDDISRKINHLYPRYIGHCVI